MAVVEQPESASATVEQAALGRLLAAADPGAPEAVARALEELRPALAAVPLPGAGATPERFALLARLGAASPALARLAEGHLDALAILAELGVPAPDGALLGVWAAEPRGAVVEARADGDGARLSGTKPFASGAGTLTHALVTARAGDERLLFLLGREAWRVLPGTWAAVGMEGSDSPDVVVDARVRRGAQVGAPGAYLARPGFWHGGVGVAAVWHGCAEGVAAALRQAVGDGFDGPHALAHLGAVEAALAAGAIVLAHAASAIDDDPADVAGEGERRARLVRAIVEREATDVLDHVGRALGALPLCHDRAHARRVADLTVYLRQSHAEADLAALGRLAARS